VRFKMKNLKKIHPLNPFLRGLCSSLARRRLLVMLVVLSVRSVGTPLADGRTRFDRLLKTLRDDVQYKDKAVN